MEDIVVDDLLVLVGGSHHWEVVLGLWLLHLDHICGDAIIGCHDEVPESRDHEELLDHRNHVADASHVLNPAVPVFRADFGGPVRVLCVSGFLVDGLEVAVEELAERLIVVAAESGNEVVG